MSDPTRRRLGVAVLTLPALLVSLDLSVLLVALPRIGADLGADATDQLWITDAYGFAVAGLLVTAGTLGDRFGRRRLLLGGAAAFGLASLAAAWAPTVGALVAARVVLGVSGATLLPSALAMVAALIPDSRERTAALAVVFSGVMAGGALGPLLGGVLLQWFWWGAAFLPGVVVMATLLVAGPLLLPAAPGSGAGRLDPLSVVLSVAAVLPVVGGLKELARGGAVALGVGGCLVGVAAGAAFVRRQRRLAAPLLDLRLLGGRSLRAALLVMVVGGVVMGGVFLTVTEYLQRGVGLSPLAAGAAMVPATGAMLVGVLVGPRLAARRSVRSTIVGGLVLAAAGFGSAAAVGPSSVPALVGTIAVALVGMGLPGGLGLGLVLGAAPDERAGAASALAETGQELGMALGIAGLGSLALAVGRAGAPAGAVATGATGGAALAAVLAVAALLLVGLAVVAHRHLGTDGAPTDLDEGARTPAGASA